MEASGHRVLCNYPLTVEPAGFAGTYQVPANEDVTDPWALARELLVKRCFHFL